MEYEDIDGFQRENKSPMNMMTHPKIPSGDSPYVKAKHLQLVEKDAEASIAWFWKAINTGDRVESALKDMAAVMKQLDRADEAIEAIKSFRDRCPKKAQDSLDNILIDLYKKCRRIDEQILLIKRKLYKIYMGDTFRGKTTRTARSHGRKLQVSVQQETSRLLGNLGWAYMQKANYIAADAVYRKAQMLEPDANKAMNLALCLIKQGRIDEARRLLDDVLHGRLPCSNETKTTSRAEELINEIESQTSGESSVDLNLTMEDEIVGRLEDLLAGDWEPFGSKRLPVFEEIFPLRDQMAC